MAGLGELLRRIARDLEQAGAQQPADDLRARLGYGPGGDDDDDDVVDEPAQAAAREPDAVRQPGAAGEADTVRKPKPARRPAATPRGPETVWKPAATREPAALQAPTSALAALRPSGATHRAPPSPPHPPASPESLLSERIRARLRTPDALREAFVVKELLDRPAGRRRTR